MNQMIHTTPKPKPNIRASSSRAIRRDCGVASSPNLVCLCGLKRKDCEETSVRDNRDECSVRGNCVECSVRGDCDEAVKIRSSP